MATVSALFFVFLLLCNFREVLGAEMENYHDIRVASLLPKQVCSSPKDIKRQDLKMAHRHGPCSPFTEKMSPRQILLKDQLRVESLKSILTERLQVQKSSAKNKIQARSAIPFDAGNYVVTVGFGTPTQNLTLIFDTGSDLTWIQCKPCAGICYPQKEPIFNPLHSSSYRNISCNTPECNHLVSATGNEPDCLSSTCVYGIMYGDQSFSLGLFGRETLTLTPSGVFQNFRFGCGQSNQGSFGKTAGLLGLGRDEVSLVYQTAKKFRKVFSYCLPSMASSDGYLTFGYNEKNSDIRFTPILTQPSLPSFYFLDLTGISIGGSPLKISPSVFVAGTIIDSGTVITRLPPSAYAALRSAFRQFMSAYPSARSTSLLDTCYNFNGIETIKVPKIALQFRGGINVELDISGIFYLIRPSSLSQVCLAFAGNDDAGDVSILGNTQQQTLEVVYNVGKGRIGFASGGCT